MNRTAKRWHHLAKIVGLGALLSLSSTVFAQNFVFFNDNSNPDVFLRAKVGCLHNGGYWTETNWVTPYKYDYFMSYVYKDHCPAGSKLVLQVQDATSNTPFVVCRHVTYEPFNPRTLCYSMTGTGTHLHLTPRSCDGFMVDPM